MYFNSIYPIFSCFYINFAAFATLEGEQSFLMKLVYLLGNVALLLMALYKCQSMGLLPTSPSDWIEFVEHKEVNTPQVKTFAKCLA